MVSCSILCPFLKLKPVVLLSFPVFRLPACSSGAAPGLSLQPSLLVTSPGGISHPNHALPIYPTLLARLPPAPRCFVRAARERERERSRQMAWNGGGFFGDEEEGKGLELSLGLPGYFSSAGPSAKSAGSDQVEGWAGSATAAGGKGTSGFKARPVVGWPPVRAFRRNLGAPSSKPSSHKHQAAKVEAGNGKKQGLFVKVNMDGVPIGRKVDLAAHGSYGGLSAAVDQLFHGLVAAQASGTGTGLLDGSGGEYTLVYEDHEGDQMLVGDVPWDMFIATAKRLRVLRTSDLNASSLRSAATRMRSAVDR